MIKPVPACQGVVAYRGGVILAPALGDTVGIIEAPDAAGARVGSYPVCILIVVGVRYCLI